MDALMAIGCRAVPLSEAVKLRVSINVFSSFKQNDVPGAAMLHAPDLCFANPIVVVTFLNSACTVGTHVIGRAAADG